MKKKNSLELNKRQVSRLTIGNYLRGGIDTFADHTLPPTANNVCPNPGSGNDNDPVPTSNPCHGTGTKPLGGGTRPAGAKLTDDCFQM